MVVDKTVRQQLIGYITAYCNDTISAFEFDDKIDAINTEDETVNWITNELWNYYDDCKDHKIVATKAHWDYFQRLLLILASDGNILEKKRYVFYKMKLLYCIPILIFSALIAITLLSAFTIWIFDLWVISSIGTVVLRHWINYRIQLKNDYQRFRDSCSPFSDIRTIMKSVKSSHGFHKQQYRYEIKNRKVRNAVLETNVDPALWFFEAVFAPIVAIFSLRSVEIKATKVVFG